MNRIPGLILTAVVLTGCSGGCVFDDTPRSRLGALPFPGAYTLYTRADPEELGRHRYSQVPRFLFIDDETQRGIIYTIRAGFLDLAHLRMSIDWTRYYAREIKRAIGLGRTHVTLAGTNSAKLHVTLDYPDWWPALTATERAELTRELAVRIGQRLAHSALTWHEIITWFGYRNVLFVDESPSSFTYDDTMSHVVGVQIGGQAVRDETRGFNEAATQAIRRTFARLGAVKPRGTDMAVRAVEGLWWADGKPLKRQMDIGPDGGVIYPWLVRGLAFCPDFEPEPFHLPTLDDVLGRDFSGFYSAEIEPRIWEEDQIRQHLPDHPQWISRERDLPILLETVESQMAGRFGADALQPWPAPPTTSTASRP